ncbi:hypothetical protein IFM89_024748 [Coptis chinensis]|uniref:Uncharacterized protein n=1 Tax=Coptis chinensis TaxID=261450 RepID=A0A835LEH0_9MAGN|nr:hypothetical protein IFM89_024748 [Coptis chinensis]
MLYRRFVPLYPDLKQVLVKAACILYGPILLSSFELWVRVPQASRTVLGATTMKGRKVTNLSKDGSTDFITSNISDKQEVKDPFYVLDLGILVSLMEKWTRTMPIVRPFYLCQMQSREPAFLGALAALGAGFDCASR